MRWFVCCMTFVLWLSFSPAPIAHAASSLSVGFSAVDITPDAKTRIVWLAGLALNRRATGMHDPLYARAAVLEDGSKKIALVAVDSIGLMYPSLQRVRAALDTIDYVLVASTHTHEGPDVVGIWGPTRAESGVDPAYLSQMETGIVQAVREASASTVPARARYGTAEDKTLLRDYRLPNVYDPVLRTVLFERISDGKACGAIVQWNSHMIEPGENTLITRDSAGVTVDTLESRLGCRVVYFSGAVGGLMGTPDQMFLDKFGEAAREKPFECIVLYGELVADLANKALRTAKEIPLTPMVVSARPIALPLDNPGFRRLRAAGVLERPAYAPGNSPEDIGAPVARARTDERQVVQSEVAYLRLGDLHVATIPGEIYPELVYGQYPSRAEPGVDYPSAPLEPHVMGMLPGKHTLLLGLANDAIGYIIPKRQWDTKPPFAYNRESPQYGEVNSLGPETAGVLLEALRRRVAEVNGKF